MRTLAVTTLGLGLFFACSESEQQEASEADSAGTAGAEQMDAAEDDAHLLPGPPRVVGYIPTYRSLDPASYDLAALTHLCIAFANPTGEGSESDFDSNIRDQIQPIIDAAHDADVLVLASIAGGTQESGELVAAQTVPDNVDAYVAGLVDLVERYGLDGIDNDIEGEAVNEDYEPFVQKLRVALPDDKLLTAAIATKNGEPVSDGALAEYDFVNIMAYDHCSWTDEACDQASIGGVEEDLAYWTEERGVPRSKAVLGVPFYGWCWGCRESQTALTYPQILRDHPDALTEDWIEDGEVTISLNSAKTIEEKAHMAHDYGGIMIWELGQDAAGDASLLQVIKDAQE